MTTIAMTFLVDSFRLEQPSSHSAKIGITKNSAGTKFI